MWRKITGAAGECQRDASCIGRSPASVSSSLTGLVIMSDFQPDPLAAPARVAPPPWAPRRSARRSPACRAARRRCSTPSTTASSSSTHNGLTIFLNEAAVRMLGYTVREVLGKSDARADASSLRRRQPVPGRGVSDPLVGDGRRAAASGRRHLLDEERPTAARGLHEHPDQGRPPRDRRRRHLPRHQRSAARRSAVGAPGPGARGAHRSRAIRSNQ